MDTVPNGERVYEADDATQHRCGCVMQYITDAGAVRLVSCAAHTYVGGITEEEACRINELLNEPPVYLDPP